MRRGIIVSGGLVPWSPDDLVDDLLRRADEAPYVAKRGGGNAVTTDRDAGVPVSGPLND